VGENYLLFQTRGVNSYLYDTATNSVHPLNPPLDAEITTRLYAAKDGRELQKIIHQKCQSNEKLLFYIRLWRANTGAFCNSRPPSSLSFQRLTDIPPEKRGPAWMSDLVLIASEVCNMRCAYCCYSSLYSGYRIHAIRQMPWEVVRKAIDWFYHYNDELSCYGYPDRNLNIIFYGGEPFLNFKLIQRSMLYAEQAKQDHYGLVLNISTNLTLMKEEYLPFLRNHKVFLNVSLDGPPEEHDKYRSFINGMPTHKIVVSNLEKIRRFDDNYYFNRVRLLTTLNGNSNAFLIYKYFEERKKEFPPFLMVNFIKDLAFSQFHQIYPFNKELFIQNIDKVINSYIEHKLQGKHFFKGDFCYHFIEDPLVNVFQRIHSYGLASPPWYTGTCLPGRKLAVTPDGRFHICERINEHFPIGDVEKGIDENKIMGVVNKYFQNLPDCHLCWARNLCTICYATACTKGGFDFTFHCESALKSIKANLILLYSILEKRQDAFSSKDALIQRSANLYKWPT